MLKASLALAVLAASVAAHGDHEQKPVAGPHKSLWYNALPGDGGTQADSVFSGISTFGRLPYFPCLASDDEKYDIAFLGEAVCLQNSLSRMTKQASLQAPRSILAPPTDRELASAQVVLDKVLAVSTYSTFPCKHMLTSGALFRRLT
ncbi:hypothetical protein MMC27_007154 [Xylographa pallens]|nr:hypothetical protein [Xylographa pallens]